MMESETKNPLFDMSQTKFFSKAWDIQLEFSKNDKGEGAFVAEHARWGIKYFGKAEDSDATPDTKFCITTAIREALHSSENREHDRFEKPAP